MNLADVFTVLFVILGFLIVFIGYWLMAAGLFPRFVERCSEQIGTAPVKTALLGLVTFGPLVAIGLAISTKAPNAALKIIGLGFALLAVLGGLFGSAGLALRIGSGLKSARDEQEPWRRILRGGIVLALTFVMPFLGQVVVLPFALLAGFGAFAISVLKRRPALRSIPETAPLAAPIS